MNSIHGRKFEEYWSIHVPRDFISICLAYHDSAHELAENAAIATFTTRCFRIKPIVGVEQVSRRVSRRVIGTNVATDRRLRLQSRASVRGCNDPRQVRIFKLGVYRLSCFVCCCLIRSPATQLIQPDSILAHPGPPVSVAGPAPCARPHPNSPLNPSAIYPTRHRPDPG